MPTGIIPEQSIYQLGQGSQPLSSGGERAKSLLFSEVAALEHFVPSPLKIEPTQTYLPDARPFRSQENYGVHPARSPFRILVRHSTAAMQTSPIWIWHVATQMSEMIMPASMCLVGERY